MERSRTDRKRRIQGRVRAGLLILLAFAGKWCAPAPLQAAEEIEVRLHFSWGGSSEQQWRGRVSIPAGRLSDMSLLGVAPEQPGSIQLHGQQILIQQKLATRYDGFEVTVTAARDAPVRIELLPAGASQAQITTFTIDDVLKESQSKRLDDRGSRLVVRRLTSDRIPVTFDRRHLIFEPGESFRFGVLGKLLKVSPNSNVRCQMTLRKVGSRGELWDETLKSRVDKSGSWLDEQFVTLDVPTEEGVYDLSIEMSVRRLTPPFSSEVLAQRWLQFVVIDPQQTTASSQVDAGPDLVLEVDPTQANWFQRLTRLPQWTLLPGFRPDGPLGNVKPERVEREGSVWTQLPPGGWQAYPLPIDQIGQRHELLIPVPRQHAQSLSFSLVEANAAEKVIPVGVDSGVIVERSSNQALAPRPMDDLQHRLPFWPKSKTPLLLVTNLDRDNPAIFGPLKVYRQAAQQLDAQAALRRSAVAFFERPLFPETFSATEALDAQTGRSLEDWQTFYEGAMRLISHARDVGYDALAIAVATEGSTLYPSQLLEPTPKHDRGIFFSTGQDPIRKDVLELLFQLCDREGIRLIPTVEFATPLPRLERTLLDSQQGLGIPLENALRQRYVDLVPPQRGRAAYYNPLDERVQREMRSVVLEIARRYGHHNAFAGISINMHGSGFSQLPDSQWGADARTWQHFCQATQQSGDPERMSTELQEAWLEWRSLRLGQLYTAMARDIQSVKEDTRLYLATSRLVSTRPMQRAFRPTLPPQSDLAHALRSLALDPKYFEEDERIVFMRPRFYLPPDVSNASLTAAEINQSEDVDHYFAQRTTSGTSLLHEPQLMRLPSFDDASPFGASNTFMSLVTQLSPAGSNNRRRFAQALAREDSRVIFEGGWRVATGQDDALREFFRVYRELPDVPFANIDQSEQWQPLRIRSATFDNQTYLYVVNDSPWYVGATIKLTSGAGTKFTLLGRDDPRAISRNGTEAQWNLTLEPYDLVALRADQLGVTVMDVGINLPIDLMTSLSNHIDQLARRAAQLSDPEPLGLLDNRSFDRWPASQTMPVGWAQVGNVGAIRRETREVYSGDVALRAIVQGGKLELLSDPVDPPESGRLSVSLRAKVKKPGQGLRIRLLLEVDGRKYYPWSAIGVGDSGRVLESEWKEFVFRVSQLPPVHETIRIGVEVSGQGEVLLDQVGLFDVLVLDDNELQALARMLTVADHKSRQGKVSDCLRVLNSYWPQYLTDNVPEVEADVAERRPAPPARQKPAIGWFERLNPLR